MRIYVNWETQEVLGANQSDEWISDKQTEYMNDAGFISDFLEDHTSIYELWNMDSTDKEHLFENLEEFALKEAESDFAMNFCDYEVE